MTARPPTAYRELETAMTTTPLTDQQLDEYERLIADTTPQGAATASPGMARVLLAEVRRLQSELAKEQENYRAYRIGVEGAKQMLTERLAKEQRLHGDTIDDRDRAQDAADKLAYAVAPDTVIGEHTADNSPWANALELVTPAAEVDKLRKELAEYEVLNPQQCPAGKHADWLVDSEYAHACPWCEIEARRLAASEALHLGNGAPWDAITDRAGELSRRDVEAKQPETARAEDTLPSWLYSRFIESLDAPAWDLLTDGDRAYWAHQADAVRRAVARNGFKPDGAASAAAGSV